jgi:hypothetical protein
MTRRTRSLAPVPTVISFIDCINRGDLDGLGRLMAEDHRLQVLDEKPLIGRSANIEAWRGYFDSFPHYVIYPHVIVDEVFGVAVLGHTTGSHLGLPDDAEAKILVIWQAYVAGGFLRSWSVIEDTPEARAQVGLPPDAA